MCEHVARSHSCITKKKNVNYCKLMDVTNKQIKCFPKQTVCFFLHFNSLNFPVIGFNRSSGPKNAIAVNDSGSTSVSPASMTRKYGN